MGSDGKRRAAFGLRFIVKCNCLTHVYYYFDYLNIKIMKNEMKTIITDTVKFNHERGKIGCVVEGSMVLKEGTRGCFKRWKILRHDF